MRENSSRERGVNYYDWTCYALDAPTIPLVPRVQASQDVAVMCVGENSVRYLCYKQRNGTEGARTRPRFHTMHSFYPVLSDDASSQPHAAAAMLFTYSSASFGLQSRRQSLAFAALTRSE